MGVFLYSTFFRLNKENDRGKAVDKLCTSYRNHRNLRQERVYII